MQTLPAYNRAAIACSYGQYQKAADILATMQKSTGLKPDQKEFCHQQELICLGHLDQLIGLDVNNW